jgi:alanyl-tRNA synthetase
MKSPEIRNKFYNFFIKHGHTQVASSSLIPAQDPTLLFANAGMNQFKDVFLGKEKRSYTRAVSIQKCVRAGGKHNDLDNVGFTKRHLTFFEMMGNFSFGDYFKKEAIEFAWEFITKEMKLPTHNLWATVYTTDDEAYNIWADQIGIPKDRIARLGEAENFWSMGDVGPCGPCTEIHVDRGPEFGCKELSDCGPACDCDRFLEIWNLVFMQFDRSQDGTMKELAQKGVDTGMGLERLCVVVQNKDSVYQTDLFANIIGKIEELTELSYAKQDALKQAAFHVLADHIRSSTLIIADGGAPSNEGRGYVLRKIIRRAALFAQKLTDKNIFPELSAIVVADMGEYYPSLIQNQKLIYKVLQSEIEKFATNLVRGTAILESYFNEASKKSKIITGEQAFRLYDTYGFPIELVILMAGEKGFTVDTDNFEKEMAKQKEQSGKKVEDPLDHLELPANIESEFTGYQELETSSEIIALVAGNALVDSVAAGTDCWIVTRKSPYFIVAANYLMQDPLKSKVPQYHSK